jgi:tripeptide aminopeptidase
MDEHSYVMATLPCNSEEKKNAPVIGLIAHLDTSPAVSGSGVRPLIHRNYQGGDIILGDSGVVTTTQLAPKLKNLIGHDIITSDGTTLLGADNKAGIAEIMDAVAYLQAHPEIPHGTIKIGFTPDEEVGRGTEKFDVVKFGAKFAYTVDGGECGELETETFSADGATLSFKGINVHPGYAKGIMVNAIKVASHFMELLPKDTFSPETTDGREGFVHCGNFNGNEELCKLKFIIRDFDALKLKEYEEKLRQLAAKACAAYPGSSFELEVKEQYRNMHYILKDLPEVEERAHQAMTLAGITPIRSVIRGGTDGSRLSYMGLPTPNLFTGGHLFHSLNEFVSVQDMQASVRSLVYLASLC